MLQLTMKCWNSAFNAQGSTLIIVIVQLGAVKIYVAVVEALKQGKTGWNSVYYQIWWFSEFHPLLNANLLFLHVFFESHPVYGQTQGSGVVFFLLYG